MFAAEVSSPSLDTFLALKPRWKVSVAAMVMRCKQLEIIDEAYGVRLWKNYSARGWRRGEPLDDTHPFEAMRLLPRAVNMVVEATQMSKAALLERLGFFGGDAASLCSLPEGFFDAQASITRLDPVIRMRTTASASEAPPGAANVLPFTRR
jgi:hypothetical protein